jgi:alpha-L-fucosidase
MEQGALIQFNIGEYSEIGNDYACSDVTKPPPSPKEFAPMALNATAWMESIAAYGGKYAVLTTQAGCGFDLWPSNVTLPNGARYNYTVRESARPIDLVRCVFDTRNLHSRLPLVLAPARLNRSCV